MVAFTTLLGGVALLAGTAIAQTPNSSFNSSVIDQVAQDLKTDPGQASAWCNAQYRACNVLCDEQATNNTCVSATLNYTCTCASNNSAPAFEYYNPTMLTNICNRYLGDCLATNANFADRQDACKNEIICGNNSIDAYASASHSASTASSTSSSSSSSSTAGSTGSPTTSNAPPAASTGAAVLLEANSGVVTGIFGAAVIAAFGAFL